MMTDQKQLNLQIIYDNVVFGNIKMISRIAHLYLIFFAVSLTAHAAVTFAPCTEAANRQCPTDTNQTDFLLSMKKGGTNVLSNSSYLYDFFLCEQYNYDCGYVPANDSFINIANGVDLNMTVTQLDAITTNSATMNKIQPYLGARGEMAVCGQRLFPLLLTAAESKQVLDGYMGQLITNVTPLYNSCRNTSNTSVWGDININIRTAILQKLKANESLIDNSTFWDKICTNQYLMLSEYLKDDYKQQDKLIDLHAAYLIDSVTQQCDKEQSVNFLVDESGSIGSTGFQLALDFLKMYVQSTNDNLQKMSIHFFDFTFQQYINYGHDKNYFITQIPIKNYRRGGTYTGGAINDTIDKIKAANFPNGLPKVLVVMTDGGSSDSVIEASKKASDNGIIPIAVGIGANVNTNQLIEIAQTPSNYIQINSYADLPKLVKFIANYFCKQIITIELNQTIEHNFVRVPSSPSYFRVIKSPMSEGQQYELDIVFENDPIVHNQSIDESQIDPFPDQFTQYTTSQYYQIYDPNLVAVNNQVQQGFTPMKVYFIQPENQIEYRVKKDLKNKMNATVSYVAVRGNNMAFNISLRVCQTLKCDQERQYYQSILNKKTKDQIIIVPQQQDLSIFIVIGSTLAVLATLCLIFILGCRKFDQQEEKDKKRSNIPVQTIPTQQFMDETLVPVDSCKKMSNKSQKSSDDGRKSKKGGKKQKKSQKHSASSNFSHSS